MNPPKKWKTHLESTMSHIVRKTKLQSGNVAKKRKNSKKAEAQLKRRKTHILSKMHGASLPFIPPISA